MTSARVWDAAAAPPCRPCSATPTRFGGRHLPDGQLAATVDLIGIARLWRRTRRPGALSLGDRVLTGWRAESHGGDFSPDGERIHLTHGQGTAQLWERTPWLCTPACSTGRQSASSTLAPTASSAYPRVRIASCGSGTRAPGPAAAYGARWPTWRRPSPWPASHPTGYACSPGPRITQAASGTPPSQRVTATLSEHTGAVQTGAISPDGLWALTGQQRPLPSCGRLRPVRFCGAWKAEGWWRQCRSLPTGNRCWLGAKGRRAGCHPNRRTAFARRMPAAAQPRRTVVQSGGPVSAAAQRAAVGRNPTARRRRPACRPGPLDATTAVPARRRSH